MGKKLFLTQCVTLLMVLILHPVPLVAGEIELGAPFPITLSLPGDRAYSPKVAYNSIKKEYLVVYQWSNNIIFPGSKTQIHGARISEDGKLIAVFQISDLADNCIFPDVAFDPINNQYLVVWSWDKNGDFSDWDLKGRFITSEGPDSGTTSFTVSQQTQFAEFVPRLVYGASQKDFLVVMSLTPHSGVATKQYIIGLRVKADGSGMPNSGDPDFSISHTEILSNPTVTYNTTRDEYLVVYDNAEDIFARRIKGFTAGLTGSEITVAGWPGEENRPAAAFSSKKDMYVITWDANKSSGKGAVYGRFVKGDGSVSTVFRLDDDLEGEDRPDFTTAVACKQDTDECLVYWIGVKDSTYYTIGRQLHADGAMESSFPFGNLNTVASWGSDTPQISIAGGSQNYFMAYKNALGGDVFSIWGQETALEPFPWPMFLSAITGKKPITLNEDTVTRYAAKYDGITYHYDLYVPLGYNSNPQQTYPIIFIFSPNGNAVMGNMENWIRSKKWLAAMMVESQNNEYSWDTIDGNFYSAHDDVVKRARVKSDLKFITGFSGGARASSHFAVNNLRPGLQGLFLQGAGSSEVWLEGKVRNDLYIFTAFGSSDFNLPELGAMQNILPAHLLNSEIFSGGHQPAPAATAERALNWLETQVNAAGQ